jgi:hypothetical protein
VPRGFRLTQRFYYTEYLGHRLLEVIVHDLEVR